MTTATPSAWYCPLDDWAVLRVSGADAAQFLQGQATTDIQTLAFGTTGCGAFCSPKGRVIANFRIAREQDGFLIFTAADLVQPLYQRLRKYVLRARVTLSLPDASERLIGLGGNTTGLPDGPCFTLNDHSGRAIGFMDPLSAPINRVAVSADAWRLADIEAGFALIRAGTSEAFLPQMLNLDWLGGIGLQKGCYTGQEIVTRTHYLGQLKRRLYRCRIEANSEPPPGTELQLDGQTVGELVNVCAAGQGPYSALAVVTLAASHNESLHLAGCPGAVRLERM